MDGTRVSRSYELKRIYGIDMPTHMCMIEAHSLGIYIDLPICSGVCPVITFTVRHVAYLLGVDDALV